MSPVKIINEADEAKVLFIIGNGFDIGLGLKTRYDDMYEDYIKHTAGESDIIKKFKNHLKNHRYDTWSDFEMGMAEYAKNLYTENELIECVRDFKKHMVEHLSKEYNSFTDAVDKISYFGGIINTLDRSIVRFYDGLTPNAVNDIEAILANRNIRYNYLIFNYTETFETLLRYRENYNERMLSNKPIHIHGIMGEDIVLGIDNISQMIPHFHMTKKGKRAFIKPEFVEQYDKRRLNRAYSIIEESDVICVYGFSMGGSDRRWVALLKEWLLASPEHHLVVFQYDENQWERYNADEIMDVEDEKKISLLKKLGENENSSIFQQIHIPIGYDIFNFSLGIKKDNETLSEALSI